jgi:hypothetical protein
MDACKLGTDQSMLPCAVVLVDSRVGYSRLLRSGLVLVLVAFVPTRPRTYVAARTYPRAHARSVVAPRSLAERRSGTVRTFSKVGLQVIIPSCYRSGLKIHLGIPRARPGFGLSPKKPDLKFLGLSPTKPTFRLIKQARTRTEQMKAWPDPPSLAQTKLKLCSLQARRPGSKIRHEPDPTCKLEPGFRVLTAHAQL